MLRRVVAVEPRFQSNCAFCQNPLLKSPILCGTCLEIQPFRSLDAFSIFGIKPTIFPNISNLQAQYYVLIQQLHPDRFALKDERQKRQAHLWSTALNSALKTLKDSSILDSYFLSIQGKTLDAFKRDLPVELVQLFFETQELEEDSGEIENLKNRLEIELLKLDEDLHLLDGKYQIEPNEETLNQIGKALAQRRYLITMQTSLEGKSFEHAKFSSHS